jgi:hypothetical protein
MAPRRQIDGGRLRAFWLGARHWRALLAFQERHGLANHSAALRAVLDLVAETEGVGS